VSPVHGEAFALMAYRADDGSEQEVAPILLEHAEALHLNDRADLTKAVTAAINTLTLPALAMLLSAFDEAVFDEDLTRSASWPGSANYYSAGDRAKSWRKRLVTVWAYPWSPVERELLGETLDIADPDVDDESRA
jgi:hypothetical protein